MSSAPPRPPLAQLRPRPDTLYASQGRSVLATGRDGFITDGVETGLFVHETRLLSRYRYLVNGEPLQPVVLANTERPWLGYYIGVPPGIEMGGGAEGGSGMVDPATKQTLELRLARRLGRGMQEDVQLKNFTQKATSFELTLEVSADFADIKETDTEGRKQQGERTREWRRPGAEGVWELAFDYRAAHDYAHQGAEEGTARLHRGAVLRVEEADSPPSFDAEEGSAGASSRSGLRSSTRRFKKRGEEALATGSAKASRARCHRAFARWACAGRAIGAWPKRGCRTWQPRQRSTLTASSDGSRTDRWRRHASLTLRH